MKLLHVHCSFWFQLFCYTHVVGINFISAMLAIFNLFNSLVALYLLGLFGIRFLAIDKKY
jgi:hypothetical protein